MSSINKFRRPVFPFEIISNILKLGLVRRDCKYLLIRPKNSSEFE
jgi:hypothetical protein